jgi:tripartite-type tricarboxylate transporter receptor subunit TctC
VVHIPYAGAAPAQLGLLAGQTDLMFDNLASALPQIQAGKLKALAVTTPQRVAALPGVPTMAEAGLPGFDVSTWFGLFAPAGTPAATVDKLNAAFVARASGTHGRRALAHLAGRVRGAGQERTRQVSEDRAVLRRQGRLGAGIRTRLEEAGQ